MASWTADVTVGAALLLAGISLLLAGVGFLSFARLRHGRLLWIGLAFLGFAAEGVALAWWAYERRADLVAGGSTELPLLALANLGIVLCLYFAVLKR